MIGLIALLLAMSTWLLMPPATHPRLRSLVPTQHPDRERASPRWLLPAALVIFGIGMTVALGSFLGVILGVLGAIVVPRILNRVEGRGERERQRLMQRQLPHAADLLAAALASGAPIGRAVAVVAGAVDPPMRDALGVASAALDLGASTAEAWRLADADGLLADISGGFERAERSGAPLARVLAGVATDLRRRHRQDVEVDARVAGVRAIAPLAACFLPAFMLVGAVPIVASFATGLFT